MRFFMGLVLALALGVTGCSETSGTGGDGGAGGDGGSGGDAATFSYSVITSSTGEGTDLLEELRSSTLPALEEAGAVVYAVWGPRPGEDNETIEEAGYQPFSGLEQDKLVVMLVWPRVDESLLDIELERIPGASRFETTLFVADSRGDPPLTTGEGFYVHRFQRYRTEDIDEAILLSEEAWVTWEPWSGCTVPGIWRDLREEDGLTWHVRIVRYPDLQKWIDTRRLFDEPISAPLIVTRDAMAVDSYGRSLSLLEP